MSRTIVQLSCRPCDAGEVVHQALQENDVTFHLVTKHKVTMAGPDAKRSEIMARKLLGFDSKFGYTVRGKISLLKHVIFHLFAFDFGKDSLICDKERYEY